MRFVKSQASNYGVTRCMRNTSMIASKLLNGTNTMVTKKVSEWVKSLTNNVRLITKIT